MTAELFIQAVLVLGGCALVGGFSQSFIAVIEVIMVILGYSLFNN